MAENWIIEQTVELTRPVQPYVGHPVELMLPGDHLAHTLRIKCKEKDMPVNLTGYTAAGYFKRTDGNTVLVVGSITNNVVDVTLSQECYAFAGNLRGVVRITNSTTDAKITLCDRLFHVGQAVDDGGTIDPGEVIPSLDDLLAEIDAMEQATAAAEAAADAVPDMVAPVFSTSTAYSAGNYIYYDGALYRFTTDHAAGAWNSAQAVAVTVGGEVADLKSATTHSIKDTNLLIYNLVNNGTVEIDCKYYQGNISSSTGELDTSNATKCASDYIFIPEGAELSLSFSTGYGRNKTVWYSADKTFISSGLRPAGAVFARIVVTKATTTDTITPTEAKNNTTINITVSPNIAGIIADYKHGIGISDYYTNKLIYNLIKDGVVAVDSTYYQGNIIEATGVLNPSDLTRCATDFILFPEGTTLDVVCETGYVVNSTAWYAADKTFLGNGGTRFAGAVFVRKIIRKSTSTDAITPIEAENNTTIKLYASKNLSGITSDIENAEKDIAILDYFESQIKNDYYNGLNKRIYPFTQQATGSQGGYYGYAYPIKEIFNINKIWMNGYANESGTLYAGIAKTITANENPSTKEYIVSGSASISTTSGYIGIELSETCKEMGGGYIVLYSDKKLTSRDHSTMLNTDVLDSTKTTYYIENNQIIALASNKSFKWSPTIQFDRYVHEPKIVGSVSTMTHLYVSTNGSDETGDGTQENPYASIFMANSVITDNSALKEYTIHVADGTYTDLQTKYSGAAQSTAYQGVIAKDHVYYEGNRTNPNNVVIEWDGSTGYDANVFNYADYGRYKCPFHIVGSNSGGGKTAIRGFKFVCSNTRYCMHIDTSGYGKGVDWVIEDCIFDWLGTPDCPDRVSSPPTIGHGSSSFENGLIKNCIIKNASGIENGFMNHDCEFAYDSGTLKCGADLTIENCDFNGGDEQGLIVTMRNLVSNNNYTLFNKVQLINCNGIDTFTYSVSSPATACNWRADVKCTPITTNRFQTDGYMQ